MIYKKDRPKIGSLLDDGRGIRPKLGLSFEGKRWPRQQAGEQRYENDERTHAQTTARVR